MRQINGRKSNFIFFGNSTYTTGPETSQTWEVKRQKGPVKSMCHLKLRVKLGAWGSQEQKVYPQTIRRTDAGWWDVCPAPQMGPLR